MVTQTPFHLSQDRRLPEGRILIVDDDGDMLADCVEACIAHGYEVVTARDSDAVSLTCQSTSGSIDVLGLDLSLERETRIEGLIPRAFGHKIAAMMTLRQPNIRIVLTTCTPLWKLSRHKLGATLSRFPVVQRPCAMDTLIQQIDTLLTDRRARVI